MDVNAFKSEVGVKCDSDGKKTVAGKLMKDKVADDLKPSSAAKSAAPNHNENELIDLDEIELSDEDTWLYTSPKNLSMEEKGLSPYKWLRKDVEDPNNRELQMAKTALVSKLDELDILKAIQSAGSTSEAKPVSSPDGKEQAAEEQGNERRVGNCDNAVAAAVNDVGGSCSDPNISAKRLMKPGENNQVSTVVGENMQPFEPKPLNVTDVLERARLQEESLRQSSSRFFSQGSRTLPRAHYSSSSSSPVCVPMLKMTKPASIEALHACNGKMNPAISPTLVAVQPKAVMSSPNGSPYGSTVSLNHSPDGHRSSLPNLNKGYHSLKPKKAKRTSEPRVQCPLPVYPKAEVNGRVQEASNHSARKGRGPTLSCVLRESQTLPASYRTKTKNNPNRDCSYTTSLRRESAPSPQCQKNAPQRHMPYRQSPPPSTAYSEDNYYKEKQRVPQELSPKKNVHTLNQFQNYGGSSPTLQGSNKTPSVVNHLAPEVKDLATKEFPRSSSHSPVKRQPLTSVHNCSPKQNDSSVMCGSNNDIRKSSLPSKIPSPASRSGIPVPSQFIARTSGCNDSWSQDLY